MGTQEIVNKLWNLCNVLRDDGITYHQYVTELTYILFLKMAKETGSEREIPEEYRWENLAEKEGQELHEFYRQLLLDLGKASGKVGLIYNNAQTNISQPVNLHKIIKSIDELDWFSAKEEGLGDMYEGLLEKNANEKKSGAGQYFTPRPLINVMVRLMKPQLGEICNDPACGTFGFMVAAHNYLYEKYDEYMDADVDADFQVNNAFTGGELVAETHRLALMNAMLHGLDSHINLGDTLSKQGELMKNYDLVLTNPPFGTKKGGDRPTRSDLTFPTSNKQLNFLQHIYRSLHIEGGARAAVILPDNVLFEDGDGRNIRKDLMDKCNLHTILRLPTGIFYAQGVKTNILFFERGRTDKKNTKEVWFYDLRTNMPNFGKNSPLTEAHFTDFETAYEAKNRAAIKDERWSCFSRAEISENNDLLDLGEMPDDNLKNGKNMGEPIDIVKGLKDDMKAITSSIESIIKILDNEK
ncbi:N-6 DNA methylase [Ancylomarina longa]|uniref:site-specific DNA-methyltransferase (adenine-specific) n=1 Tax=Ancylomarina longa TaxID=2487017 RepID=A0A434AX16_9BACT|nr:N-6 DNA methylase [Ancylomarina longa]RUT78947.1 SAM-dependent methyltransferase [Ancylomarina longa]